MAEAAGAEDDSGAGGGGGRANLTAPSGAWDVQRLVSHKGSVTDCCYCDGFIFSSSTDNSVQVPASPSAPGVRAREEGGRRLLSVCACAACRGRHPPSALRLACPRAGVASRRGARRAAAPLVQPCLHNPVRLRCSPRPPHAGAARASVGGRRLHMRLHRSCSSAVRARVSVCAATSCRLPCWPTALAAAHFRSSETHRLYVGLTDGTAASDPADAGPSRLFHALPLPPVPRRHLAAWRAHAAWGPRAALPRHARFAGKMHVFENDASTPAAVSFAPWGGGPGALGSRSHVRQLHSLGILQASPPPSSPCSSQLAGTFPPVEHPRRRCDTGGTCGPCHHRRVCPVYRCTWGAGTGGSSNSTRILG